MRIVLYAAPLALALGLSACASGMGGDHYTSETDRLRADCEARGGVYAPTGGNSGRPQTDNTCKLTSLPSR